MRLIAKQRSQEVPARRTVALFGGAFNPPHRGHVALLRALLRRKEIDQVWVLPVYRHPFRKKMAPFSARFQMCRLAFAGLSPRVTVKRLEANLGGTSYTVRTLQHLTRRYPATRFVLVVGADSYRARGQWKDFAKIRELADLLVVPRGRGSPFPAVSSSAFRAGRLGPKALPPKVASYVARHRLYPVSAVTSKPSR